MCAEDEAGQPQVHIVTPVPLPYTARSTAVLRSMMYETTPSPGIPLLDDLLDDDPIDSVGARTGLPQVPTNEALRITRLENPIEPLLLALLSPETAKEQDNIFVPPSAYCQCKADCIRWACVDEYTRNMSLNAWGY
ncbi:hypothetical protein AX14_013744 [Amanita brunnescens Koide BX004]|nr:hypothetical protein AX14_013744 [Amanita brunnescens Koide BX004]